MPTEDYAAAVVRDVIRQEPKSIRRFPMGIAHWVYDVRLRDGSSIVVRMGTSEQREDFVGALHWSKKLRPLGVPLPDLIAHGEHEGHPYLVLERLEGEDLGVVYGSLSSAERRSIAEEVLRVQRIVGTLPDGSGYGFLRLPTDRGHESWSDVIQHSLARSRARIESAGLMSLDAVHRVAEHAGRLQPYFSDVPPRPFLDDTTTKNVLVHAGRLSGIVDVDQLCFGDPLFTVGLTRAALLGSGEDPEYADRWCEALDLSEEQRQVMHFYTALFCVDLMSEFGQHFSQGVQQFDQGRLERLEKAVDESLS